MTPDAEDEFDAVARHLRESIANGQTLAETAQLLRTLALSPVRAVPHATAGETAGGLPPLDAMLDAFYEERRAALVKGSEPPCHCPPDWSCRTGVIGAIARWLARTDDPSSGSSESSARGSSPKSGE